MRRRPIMNGPGQQGSRQERVAKRIPHPMESRISRGVASEASEPAFFRQLPCWRWYGVSMVGVAELGIREYVWRKNQRRRSTSSWNSTYRRPLRGAFIKPPPQGAVADLRSVSVIRRRGTCRWVFSNLRKNRTAAFHMPVLRSGRCSRSYPNRRTEWRIENEVRRGCRLSYRA